MFDDLTPQSNKANQSEGTAPPKPQTEPASPPASANQNVAEDIFAGTDTATLAKEKPAQFQPKTADSEAPTASAPQQPPANTNVAAPATPVAKKSSKKYLVIVIIVVAVLLLILASMIALAYFKSNDSASLPTDTEILDTAEENDLIEDVPSDVNEEEEDLSYIMEEITDSDNDGLFNAEENRLGTDPNKADTDDDGLFDREEVRIYNTDPLNPDTDYDGYDDGEEVENGYNPAGPGKLFESL